MIKMMRPGAVTDAGLAPGFRGRAKARAGLRHPFVAVLHDIGTASRNGIACPYLVTEDVGGETLGSVRRHRNHPEWATSVVAELLGVLEHAHGRGVFGWRLDPDSVLFTPGNHIKVVDLGDVPEGHDDLLEAGRLLSTLITHPVPSLSRELIDVVHQARSVNSAYRYHSAGELRQVLDALRGKATRTQSATATPADTVLENPVIRFAAASHKGVTLETNEDSGYTGPRLLALADGLGSAPAGEVASSEVIASIVDLDDGTEDPPDLLPSMLAVIRRAQWRMEKLADPELRGMGTTLTALLWTGTRLGLAHIGDSRAYVLRDGTLTQITQDNPAARPDGQVRGRRSGYVHPPRPCR